MPIYEYRCQQCGHDLEVMQKISDPAPAKCPACAAENTFERLVSRTNFQLKGGGWYSDLYASAKKDGTGGTSATGTPAAGSASSTSTAAAAPAATPGGTSGGSTGGSSGGTGGSSSGSTGGTSGGGSSSGGSSGGSGTGGSSASGA